MPACCAASGYSRLRDRHLHGHRARRIEPRGSTRKAQELKLRIRRPAPTRSTSASATSTTTKRAAHGARRARRSRTPAVLQRVSELRPSGRERGRDAEDERAEERRADGEEEHFASMPTCSSLSMGRRAATVVLSALMAHHARRRPAPAPSSESSTLSASICRIRRSAACAERRADGQLALTRRRPGEDQVADIRARNQQHEADRASITHRAGRTSPVSCWRSGTTFAVQPC